MKKRNSLILGFVCILALSACRGYHIGNLKHPDIDSIAVMPLENESNRPQLSIDVQSGLRVAIQGDGTYKLKNSKEADCIIYAKVLSGRTIGVGTTYRADSKDNDDGNNYGTTMYKYEITVEYTVLLPGQNRPLIKTAVVTGENRFSAMPDIEQSRAMAARIAAEDAAKTIISSITEAW
ncbi:MAG: hypothetical protein KAG98_05690 [Lentisphaeria bacterium]|nr:hypothetical protein [Lentisphaeria bacterium]